MEDKKEQKTENKTETQVQRVADFKLGGQDEIALYSYFRSSASWRVRIVMNLKKIPFNYVAVHLLKGEQRSSPFLEVNPTGLVPALHIDGHLLCESMAIVEYLEETRPDSLRLLPKDPLKRAKVREICEHINSGMQPLVNLRVLNKVGDDYKADKIAWAKYWNDLGFASLEKILEKSAGKYCVGDELTLADAFLIPQAWAAFTRFNTDKEAFPTVKRIYDTLTEIEEFKKATPQNQPDFEA